MATALALLYLPIRLVEEATPEWRLVQWALALVAVGLTLCAIRRGLGQEWLRPAAFPVSFFLVAMPWPTPIEDPIIQALSRANSALVVEVMGFLDVPALQRGNVIEVASGAVGIDEACSGIRSFQSSLMISLFLGEFYWLSLWRRLLFVPIGFALAMALNVARTSLLTFVAAKKGLTAIADYHDPAGVTILVACTAALWATALLLRSKNQPQSLTVHRPPPTAHRHFGAGLLIWLILVEASVEVWYRNRESRVGLGPKWTMAFAENDPAFRQVPIPPKVSGLLRYDEGKQGEWVDADGNRWQAFYFDWLPGRVAGYLAKRHTPEVCLTAAGCKLRSGPEQMLTTVNGLDLPIRAYVFEGPMGPLHVFHCRWEAGMSKEAFTQHESARFNLVRGIWTGRGNRGQKVIELIVSGIEDPEKAKEAAVQQLSRLVVVGRR
jgi:exosortase